mmetsp:Transcript_6692/g.14271  ORF Transcript_6692/g.14271 Transcript_6692/m.14271 type:complete len:305 (+) Transcript_6692:1400-2314(+)
MLTFQSWGCSFRCSFRWCRGSRRGMGQSQSQRGRCDDGRFVLRSLRFFDFHVTFGTRIINRARGLLLLLLLLQSCFILQIWCTLQGISFVPLTLISINRLRPSLRQPRRKQAAKNILPLPFLTTSFSKAIVAVIVIVIVRRKVLRIIIRVILVVKLIRRSGAAVSFRSNARRRRGRSRRAARLPLKGRLALRPPGFLAAVVEGRQGHALLRRLALTLLQLSVDEEKVAAVAGIAARHAERFAAVVEGEIAAVALMLVLVAVAAVVALAVIIVVVDEVVEAHDGISGEAAQSHLVLRCSKWLSPD